MGKTLVAITVLICMAFPVFAEEVWYSPNGGSLDMIDLFKIENADSWAEARKQITVFGFIDLHLDGTPEGVYSRVGPNVLANFLSQSTVPGGPFKWLNDQGIEINIEVGAVKKWSCDDIGRAIRPTLKILDNVAKNGGCVDYITIDESFASGLPKQWEWGLDTCNFTEEQTAEQIKIFVDAIHDKYPDVQIGFWEPYPYFSAEQIKRFLWLLKAKGVPVPFYSCDFNIFHAWQLDLDYVGEMADLMQFCRANGISFGANIIGSWGENNETYAYGYNGDPDKTGAWDIAVVAKAVGMPDRIMFESWVAVPSALLEQPPRDLRLYPENLPEWNPVSHTGLMLNILKFLRAQ